MCKMSITNNNINLTTDAQSEPPRTKFNHSEPQKTNNESIIKTSDAKNNVDDDEVPIRPARKKQPSSNKCVSVEPNSPPVDNINGISNVINIVNSKHVHIGGLVNINVSECEEKSKKSKNKKCKKSSMQETEAIRALKTSCEKCTRVHINIVKKHLGKNWRNFFRKLDYSEGEIEQLYIDYINEGISEVIHQGLVDWMQNNPDDATLGKICTILWDENCCDVIERLLTK